MKHGNNKQKEDLVPKIIHYCWFGGNPLPMSALKCIESWKKYFPGYEIKEWNEGNFDVHSLKYTSEAYQAKKYAFVSDYARFKILYEHGGLYFDTDVEIIKSFDDILKRGGFMGFEINSDGHNFRGLVNPGLGLGIGSHHPIYLQLLNLYDGLSFFKSDGSLNLKTVVRYTTEVLEKNGLEASKGIQYLNGINIYPKEFFNPLDNNTGILKKTKETHSIHWYSNSWSDTSAFHIKVSRLFHRFLGIGTTAKLKSFIFRHS